MTIELKQAAQQVVDAFDAFGEDDNFESLFALSQKMEALRTAIQQAEAQQALASGVQAAKLLSETQITGDNALGQILGG